MDKTNLIGRRFKIARESRGLSQKETARFVGVNRPAVVNIEKGQRKLSFEEAIAFCNLAGVTLNWLSGQASDKELLDKFQEFRVVLSLLVGLSDENISKLIMEKFEVNGKNRVSNVKREG